MIAYPLVVFAHLLPGYHPQMIWLIVLILLIAIFGLGTLLEATLWALLIIAAVVVISGLLIGRAIGR